MVKPWYLFYLENKIKFGISIRKKSNIFFRFIFLAINSNLNYISRLNQKNVFLLCPNSNQNLSNVYYKVRNKYLGFYKVFAKNTSLKLKWIIALKYPEMEFKEFEPRFKSAKTRFKLSAGLNLETFDTILSGTNHI